MKDLITVNLRLSILREDDVIHNRGAAKQAATLKTLSTADALWGGD